MGGDEVPTQIVEQRVRNRIIEYLTLAGSFALQREYQSSDPAISVANEVLNQWEDWDSEPSLPRFGPPVFTADELAALAAFGKTWDQVAHDTPNVLPALEKAQALPQWEQLRAAADAAREVFERRGRLPEDEAI